MALAKYTGGADGRSGQDRNLTINMSRSITLGNSLDFRKEYTGSNAENSLPEYKQRDAKRWCEEAMDKFGDNDFEVAKYISQKFRSEYEGKWVCVIGGCAISFHRKENSYFNFKMGGRQITLYRGTN